MEEAELARQITTAAPITCTRSAVRMSSPVRRFITETQGST